MKKAICKIINKPMDCKKCKVNDCPYEQFDNAIEHTFKVIREIVERETDEKGSR